VPSQTIPDPPRRTPAPAAPATLRPADTDTARTEPLRVRPHGFAPQPAVLGGGDPDWLAAHLARDAALNERSEWGGRWTQRLAAWGAAGVLLALLAGGGVWLYQQSQVEGALVVVANTNPAPAGAAARSGINHAAAGTPAIAPVSSSASLPAPARTDAPPTMAELKKAIAAGEGDRAVGGLAGSSTGAAAGESRETGTRDGANVAAESPSTKPTTTPATSPASTREDGASSAAVGDAQPDISPPAPKRQRSHARKRPKAETSADNATGEATYRQRREETLMQCRAHGYDERQCFQRGCEMTKYGFACKG
jgi:hypothetical protein